MTKSLKTEIAYGQRYVDEPVHVEVSRASPLALAISYLPWKFSQGPEVREIIETVSHHERVGLRWMVPDGKGGLKPKFKT